MMIAVVMYEYSSEEEQTAPEAVFGPFDTFEDASHFAVTEIVNKRGREYDWFEMKQPVSVAAEEE